MVSNLKIFCFVGSFTSTFASCESDNPEQN